MLASFRVANHRSIREAQELLLGADPQHARTVAAVYGANASGKSNLVDALRWMRDAVVGVGSGLSGAGGSVPGARLPFRLDPAAAGEPSTFAAEVVLDGVRHSYGFTLDDQRVRAEWLHTYPKGRRRLIFDRVGDRVKLGTTLPDHRARSTVLSGLTAADTPLLRVAARDGQAEVLPVYRWFDTRLRVGGADEERVIELVTRDVRLREALVVHLRAADLGITDLVVDPLDTAAEVEARLDEAREAVAGAAAALAAARAEVDAIVRGSAGPTPETRDALAAAMAAYEERGGDLREAEHQASVLAAVRDRASATRPAIRFHQGRLGATLPLHVQSTGTRRWLSLVAAALSTLDDGGLLAVDEADTSVHPGLTVRLIDLFRDPRTNPRGAQLLFTTHHERLLDEDTLDRGEVWFVEKDADTGETRLFPLAGDLQESA
jgi:hypothetical protein